MRARRTLVALGAALTAAILTAPAAHAGAGAPYFDVAKLPDPPVTGKEMADNLEAFSTTFTSRYTGTPSEQNAATMLVDELKAEGYDANIVLQPQAGEPFTLVKAVIATRKGTTHPDEEIVFTTHYDGFPRTINAAYDNGSGVQMLRALAKSVAQIKTNRTFTFAFYNGEEEGALGSKPMAQQYADEGRKVRALLGFDMVGIAYPVKTPSDITCLCMWRGEDDDAFDALQSHVAFDVLGLPNEENLVEVRGLNDRNSDEDSWDLVGYPTMRWAGLKKAGDYPEYHTENDNMATIDTVAGDRSFFERGMRNTLLTAYYTAMSMDNDPPSAKASTSGSGPSVSFDAAGSSDPDGAPSGYTWRFGDGQTATGASVTHSYEKAGDYVATLEVADNLWSPVTASAVVPVKVTQGAAAPAAKKKLSKRARCLKKARKIKSKRKRAKAVKRCKKRYKKR
jgi:hypothetical protein